MRPYYKQVSKIDGTLAENLRFYIIILDFDAFSWNRIIEDRNMHTEEGFQGVIVVSESMYHFRNSTGSNTWLVLDQIRQ